MRWSMDEEHKDELDREFESILEEIGGIKDCDSDTDGVIAILDKKISLI